MHHSQRATDFIRRGFSVLRPMTKVHIRYFSCRLLVFLLFINISCSKDKRYPDALSPEKALESFKLHEGFKIELFAAEPDVWDPVEMVFDEQGDAYVVEMPDYPFKPEPGKGAGRIKLLRDTNDDGRVDESVIFADSLSEATSILPWKGGLLVTTAPYILYLKDTDGDFKADTKEILFSGFFANNSEAQITSLRFGVDNWIYAANNGQPGEVIFDKRPDAPQLKMNGADFRFRLDREQFELESGQAQFGLTMDDWGHRFMTQNTLHIRHAVIPWRYLHRHSHLPSTNILVNISDHDLLMYQETPPPYWRAERTQRRQKQYKEQNLDREEYAEDHFTGSSGGTVYAGDGFPNEYYGNIFTGDVAGNLVHRDVITRAKESPTFVAKRDAAEQTSEFLTSTDPWFRPAGFATGPDGYLYVIDMYRQHIETPLSIPEDLKADMDFLNGSQHGRIYRILPNDKSSTPVRPDLRNKQAKDFVELLSHPNRWYRLEAQRLLIERQDLSVVPTLESLSIEHADARTRLHALYSLEGMNSLTSDIVKKALRDGHPGVREHALILSERYPELLSQLIKSIDDSTSQVSFQATLSVGQFSGTKVINALANAIEKHGQDQFFRTAVLSAPASSSLDLLNRLAKNHSFFKTIEPWKESFVEEFAFVAGSINEPKQVVSFLDFFSRPDTEKWRASAISGLTTALRKSKTADPRLTEALATISTGTKAEIDEAMLRLRRVYEPGN